MSDAQFEAFLSSCRLEEFQKAELRTTNNRLQCYRNWIFWIELNDGKTAQVALNNYLAVNSIFMTDELRQKFKAINHRRRAFHGTRPAFGPHCCADPLSATYRVLSCPAGPRHVQDLDKPAGALPAPSWFIRSRLPRTGASSGLPGRFGAPPFSPAGAVRASAVGPASGSDRPWPWPNCGWR